MGCLGMIAACRQGQGHLPRLPAVSGAVDAALSGGEQGAVAGVGRRRGDIVNRKGLLIGIEGAAAAPTRL